MVNEGNRTFPSTQASSRSGPEQTWYEISLEAFTEATGAEAGSAIGIR